MNFYCVSCSSPRDEAMCFQCDGECEEFGIGSGQRANAHMAEMERLHEALVAYHAMSPAQKAAERARTEAFLERIGAAPSLTTRKPLFLESIDVRPVAVDLDALTPQEREWLTEITEQLAF